MESAGLQFDGVAGWQRYRAVGLMRYAAWGLPRERFTLIENGLAPQAAAPPRALGAGGRRARFGYFGQLSEFKGLPVLLQAVAAVEDASWGHDAALCIFGGGLENQPAPFRQKFD